ncbi:SRPBCC family protein [Paenibacillus hemerocallicola]|uniref:SRPBCC family protein n=1 Tax=Paenibacillus hemerocallicola TaxID=1172614 RepID=A0A5C4TF91_9BACL|nr:SRPBCC family protein [Paenibacillus hemerocallicola]TNJ67069.1 SRPBCC family protein [Paenibacillus hemerocallicola]
MPIIYTELTIRAPIQRCFDLSRSIDIHMQSTAKSRERAVAGVTSGLIRLGETVTWEAVHLGVRQRLTVRITEYSEPSYFVDEMVKGAFRSFVHRHEFGEADGQTMMKDTFDYVSPLGWLGRAADKLFLEAYMRRFLLERNRYIKQVAEGEQELPK